jgi:glycogen phosphorylase
MVTWKKRIRDDWSKIAILGVTIGNQDDAIKGKEVEVSAIVDTAGHNADELNVEVVHGPVDLRDNFKVRHVTRLVPQRADSSGNGTVNFSGLIPLSHTGLYGYEIRITPDHPNMAFSHKFNYVRRG